MIGLTLDLKKTRKKNETNDGKKNVLKSLEILFSGYRFSRYGQKNVQRIVIGGGRHVIKEQTDYATRIESVA